MFAYTLSQFYRSYLAVIVPALTTELGLGSDALANMSAAFFLVFAFTQIPLGLALDRIGPRRTVPVLMMSAVAGALLLSQSRSPWQCIIANGLIGLGCSPIYMGALFVFARTRNPNRFGFLSSSLLGFGSAGNLLAATPLSLAAASFGWRAAFVGVAAITLLSAIVFWLVVRDPPRAERPHASGSVFAELAQIARMPKLRPLMPLLLFGYATVVVERGLWLGPYFADVHKLSPVALGNAALAMAAAMSVGALMFGYLDRNAGWRKPLIAAGTLLTTSAFLLLGLYPLPPVGLAVATLAFIGCLGLSNALLVAHARTFFPDHLVGRGITFVNFMSIGGAGLLQWISGKYVTLLHARGLPATDVYAALHITFGCMILCATLIYLLASTIPAKAQN